VNSISVCVLMTSCLLSVGKACNLLGLGKSKMSAIVMEAMVDADDQQADVLTMVNINAAMPDGLKPTERDSSQNQIWNGCKPTHIC